MRAHNVSRLFADAERAYVRGEFEAAKRDLIAAWRLAGEHPAILHLLALVEKNLGAMDQARLAFTRALELDPKNADLAANAGNFYKAVSEHGSSLECYELALRADPTHLTALLGRASALCALVRYAEARVVYRDAARLAPQDHRPWSGLGALERQDGNLAAASEAFDEALKLAPGVPVALHGRARVALERGEADTRARFEEVARLIPQDPHAALGAAESWVAVDPQRAIRELEGVSHRFPDWPEPQSALARVTWECGDNSAFAAGLEAAVAARPRNAAMWIALIDAYSGVDRFQDAADTAARAMAATGEERFLLLEAVNSSEAGDIYRADALFAKLVDMSGTAIAQASHCLRKGEVHQAEKLLDLARQLSPDDMAAWAWSGIVWRLLDDPRATWLYQTDRLVRVQSIGATAAQLEAIAAHVASLHDCRKFPIGQSLRGGSQTRGRLFDQASEPVDKLRKLLNAVVEAFWAALPEEDPAHPLLRHRAKAPRFAGSWSVLLTDEGFHVPHFHPRGILSSACYLRLPLWGKTEEGWLELGSPPPRLGLCLQPLLRIEPKAGALVLFPSYMFHGTVPFTKGERLTVAFDVLV